MGAYAPYSLDLHERIALGIASGIASTICPLADPQNPSYGIAASSVYKVDKPDPAKIGTFPAVVVSIEGEVEDDDDQMGFEDDGSLYPCIVRVVDRLDYIDPIKDKALKQWRKEIADLLRGARSLPGADEVWDVWVKRRQSYNENLPSTDYLTSDLLVVARAIYPRVH